MSGRRPDVTLTYNFKDDFRHAPFGNDMISLPEYFKVLITDRKQNKAKQNSHTMPKIIIIWQNIILA